MDILTNLAFWQSPLWREQTTSIYDLDAFATKPKYGSAWKEAWKLYVKQVPFDVIHTMGARTSLYYGLLCLLTGKESKQVMSEVFLDEESDTLSYKIKTWLYQKVAQRSYGILTNSTPEIESTHQRLKIPKEKLHFLPLHTNIIKPQASEQDDGFILAAGRSLRDYDTFLEAIKDLDTPVVIICGEEDLPQGEALDHVTLLREVDRASYLDHIQRCSLMVTPLKESSRSTGQVVILEAMSFGKAVVATETTGSQDYIEDGQTGYLSKAYDATDLKRAILEASEKKEALGAAGFQRILERHQIEQHAQQRLDFITKLSDNNSIDY